jgi:AcrR family transcriptional regulator
MDNRENILQCALDLFYVKGYDAAGVQEIVDAAGITKPTLYYYFGSKKGLLENVLKVYCEVLNHNLDEAVKFQGKIPDLLFYVAKAYFDFAVKYRKCYLLMLALFYSGRENEGFKTVYPLIQSYYNRIVRIFDDASGQLGNMNGRQQQFAVGFIGIMDHYLMMRQQEFGEDEMMVITDEQIRSIVHQFMYGIYS